jgi:acyl-CoA dehydrogenase
MAADDVGDEFDEFAAEARAFLDANAVRRAAESGTVQWGEGPDRIAYFSSDPPDVDSAKARAAQDWQRRRYEAGFG